MCETSVKLQRPVEVFFQGVALQGGRYRRPTKKCSNCTAAQWAREFDQVRFPLSSICRKRAAGDKYTREVTQQGRSCRSQMELQDLQEAQGRSAKARGGVGLGMEPRVQRPHEVGGGTFRDWGGLLAPRKVQRIGE